MKFSIVIAFVMMAFSLSYAEENITVSDAWVREVPPSSTVTAAYMKITSNGAQDDRLVGVTSQLSDTAEMHISTVDENGVARMSQVEGIDIPKGGTVELKPGGYHIMLIGLKGPLAGQESAELILNFKNAGEVKVDAQIKGAQAKNEASCH